MADHRSAVAESSAAEIAGGLARLVGGVVAFAAAVAMSAVAVLAFLIWLMVQQWASAERRDAGARCPERPGVSAEVVLGGWGDPDWCVYRDEDGREFGTMLLAGPIPD
jgi:hypothetical protein